MKSMKKLKSHLAFLGVLGLLGSQAQAGWLPACTQAQVDLQAQELQVDGDFRWCYRPTVWLGQESGGYEDLGTPLDWTDDFVLADLTGATVVEGATQKVVVKCGWRPHCEIDVAFLEQCADGDGAPVPRTGQTTSYATGDDGDLQKGVAWPNPRFTDNDDGTVTDNLTGLIWLKNASCPDATRNWTTALSDVAQLNTDGTMNGTNCGDTSNGGNHQTDWRMPNRNELQSLVDIRFFNPALSNAEGTAQWSEGSPFSGVQSGFYWSSSTGVYLQDPSVAWTVFLGNGSVFGKDKNDNYDVWPVRGGQ